MKPPTRLILASGSPRRQELLKNHGFVFDVVAADLDESVLSGESPDAYVERLAREKAVAVRDRVAVPTADTPALAHADVTVIGADTTVAYQGEILGKPVNAHDARVMLRRLSGATHQALTGVAVVRSEHDPVSICVRTNVTFARITDHEIDWYVATGDPLDKAGAYGIQSIAGSYVERIDGNVQNVAGLPMHHLVVLLAKVGLSPAMLRAQP